MNMTMWSQTFRFINPFTMRRQEVCVLEWTNDSSGEYSFFVLLIPDHVISITKPCGDRGVFGVGLYFTELTEEFIYYFDKYADSDESYAILVDLNGTTISHPSFVRPQLEMADDVFPTDIRFLEKIDDNIWQRWRTEVNGNVTIASADRFRKVSTEYSCT